MDVLDVGSTNQLPAYNIIVSNPPYIKQSEAKEMSSNVLLHEPHEALFVPDNDPLMFYNAIADFGLKHLSTGRGMLFFEISETTGSLIVELLQEKGFSEIKVIKDFQGKDRIISAVLIKDEMK